MALKGDRGYTFKAITDYFCNDVAERGKGVVFGPGGGSGSGPEGGSGVILEQTEALVSLAGNPSGLVPAGILLLDVVDVDLTRYHINFHKDECIKGGKVTIAPDGRWYTNQVDGTPVAGNRAYLTAHGKFTPTSAGVIATPPVGRWFSSKDENGYAGLELNLPQVA